MYAPSLHGGREVLRREKNISPDSFGKAWMSTNAEDGGEEIQTLRL